MAILKIRQQDGTWAIVNDPNAIKHIEQELTEAQKAQARANIGAAAPSEITALSNQLYDKNYGTESGMSIRYIAGQVVNDKAISLSKGTKKDDLDFTYTNGAWNISPIGNYYGSVDTAITVAGYEITDWIIKGIELANGSYKQTLISGNIELSRNTNEDMSWTEWNTKTTVLVGGNPVQTFDADSKINIPSGKQELGVIPFFSAKSQTQAWKSVGVSKYSAKAGAIPSYLASTNTDADEMVAGHLITNTPTKIAHCANKQYVDDQIQGAKDASVPAVNTANIIYGTDGTGTQTTYLFDAGYTANTIAIRGQSGRLMCGATLFDYDCANKKYVDEQVQDAKDVSVPRVNTINRIYGTTAAGDQTTYEVALGAVANAIVRRDAYGRMAIADPINANQAATKGYVDATFVNKAGDIITGDLTITGNLQIKGISETVDAVTYKVENNLIEFNPNKTYNNTWLTGIAINKGLNGETDLGTYGIMYDPNADSVKLGFGTISENHTFDFNENESAPIATREEFNDSWEDDAIFVFDKATKSFKYSGKTLSSFKEDIQDEMKAYMAQFVAEYVENYMSSETIVYPDGTTETTSDILYVNGTTTENNGEDGSTTLYVEEE